MAEYVDFNTGDTVHVDVQAAEMSDAEKLDYIYATCVELRAAVEGLMNSPMAKMLAAKSGGNSAMLKMFGGK